MSTKGARGKKKQHQKQWAACACDLRVNGAAIRGEHLLPMQESPASQGEAQGRVEASGKVMRSANGAEAHVTGASGCMVSRMCWGLSSKG